jgi:hypothetical protein
MAATASIQDANERTNHSCRDSRLPKVGLQSVAAASREYWEVTYGENLTEKIHRLAHGLRVGAKHLQRSDRRAMRRQWQREA